jgi:hypothetical protein
MQLKNEFYEMNLKNAFLNAFLKAFQINLKDAF